MMGVTKKANAVVVIIACLFAIVFGKYIRHTLMYNTLVLPGSGWYMVDKVNSGNVHFGLTISSGDDDEVIGNAGYNAMFIFSKLNFFHLASTYYGYEILISVIFNILALLLVLKSKKSYSLSEILFIFTSIAVLNIFDFCLAKEPIQMIFFIFMYFILQSKMSDKGKYIWCLLILLLCGITYRNYYILMIFYMIFLYMLYKHYIKKINNFKIKNLIFVFIAFYIFYLLLLIVAQKISVVNYKELIRVRLRTSSAVSDIRSIFNSNNLLIFTLDYIIVAIRIMFPIELIRFGFKYSIYFLYQVIMTIFFYINVKNIKSSDTVNKIALCVYVSFVMVSAAFEPDFGSWIRHEAVLFPIFLICFNMFNKSKKERR